MIDEDSFVSSFLDIPLSPSYDSMFILDDDDLVLLPSSDDPLHHQIPQELTTDEWTREEDKQFENAIAEFSDKINSSELFVKIASRVPGKTVDQIEKHYRMLVEDIDTIESGRCPIPEYLDSKIVDDDADDADADDIDVIDLVDDDDDDDDESLKQDKKKKKKEKKKGKEGPRRFRRKGVPWTDEEHSLFLEGLSKYGKGDWRSISRHYVITKTPTQVASHAQKYYLRLNSAKNNVADQGTKCQSTLQIPGHQQIYQQQITNNNLINVSYANLPMAAMDLPNFSNMYGNATGHCGPIAPPPPPPPPPPFPLQVSPAMNYQQQPLGGTNNYDFVGNSWVLNNCAFPSPASFAPNNPVLLPPAMNSVAMPPAPAYNSFGEGSYYPAQGYPMNNMMNSTNNYLQPFSYPPTYPSFPGQFPNGPE